MLPNASQHVGVEPELEVSGNHADAARNSLRVGWPAPDGLQR